MKPGRRHLRQFATAALWALVAVLALYGLVHQIVQTILVLRFLEGLL